MNFRVVRAVVIVLLLIAAVAGFGSYMYHLGVAQGIVESGRLVGPNGAPVVAFWPRPWGLGFFPFFPLLFILFWIFAARALFWGARWRRGYGGGWGSRGVPPMFEEWHRRLHEQQPPTPTKL
jgi:hypothetical protein